METRVNNTAPINLTSVCVGTSGVMISGGCYGGVSVALTSSVTSCSLTGMYASQISFYDSGPYTASLSFSLSSNIVSSSLFVSLSCSYYISVYISGCAGFSSISLYGPNTTEHGQSWTVSDCQLTQAQVDAILSTKTMNGTVTGGASLTLTGASNAQPSNPCGWGSYDYLVSHGWSVSVNGSHP